MKTDRIVVIGGGHNALVAAFYLARAGLKPLVLERRPSVGGAAITEEIHPGFRCPTLAHATGPIAPEIVRDGRLERHGYTALAPETRVCALAPGGAYLPLLGDVNLTAQHLARFSKHDADAFPRFHESMTRIGRFMARVLRTPPPSLDDPSALDLLRLLDTGRRFRRLGTTDAYRLLRWAPMAVADLAGEWFDMPIMQAVVSARGVHGAALGPWSAGSGLQLLLRAGADPHGSDSTVFARGGPAALARALASAAMQAGAEIRQKAEVARILVENDHAAGVALASGEELRASAVVSSADPKRTFAGLVDPVHLTPDFLSKIRSYRTPGVLAKVNYALSALPAFRTNGTGPLTGRIHIGPDVDYIERAFDASKYGRWSERPWLEITIPSIVDPELAPPGAHVMSVYAQYAPYSLRDASWTAETDRFADAVSTTIDEYAPGFRGLVLARQVITPVELEREYGLTGGHIFHGEMTPDQIFTMRPLIGWAQYRTPIAGLYLCGAGTHPGGGLTGLSGMLAAKQIIRELRS